MKKIITNIILVCVLCFPMMVDAREETFTDADGTKTCEIITNYYFMLEEPSSYDAEGEITNGIWTNETNYDAWYDDTIGEIYAEGLIYTESDLENYRYHTRLFAALDNYNRLGGSAEYKYNSDTYYYLQNSFESATDSSNLPFFADRYLSASSSTAKTTFKNSVANSYFYLTTKSNSTSMSCDDCIYVKRTKSSGQVKLNVIKNYSIPAARQNSTSKIFYNEPWLTVDDTYSVVFIPALYKVEHYDPDNCKSVEKTGYTITYDPNGGTGQRIPYTITEGNTHTVINNSNVTKYTREGYTFLGWNTDKNATSETYTAGNSITPTSNMTLYAIWQKVDNTAQVYKVTYHRNAGDDVTNFDEVKKGETYKVNSAVTYSRDGYQFLGWSTNKDATEADSKYNPDEIITVDKDLNLYAVWLKEGNKEEGEIGKHGLGYSIGLIGTILASTGAGVVYFKKRNKFENI